MCIEKQLCGDSVRSMFHSSWFLGISYLSRVIISLHNAKEWYSLSLPFHNSQTWCFRRLVGEQHWLLHQDSKAIWCAKVSLKLGGLPKHHLVRDVSRLLDWSHYWSSPLSVTAVFQSRRSRDHTIGVQSCRFIVQHDEGMVSVSSKMERGPLFISLSIAISNLRYSVVNEIELKHALRFVICSLLRGFLPVC